MKRQYIIQIMQIICPEVWMFPSRFSPKLDGHTERNRWVWKYLARHIAIGAPVDVFSLPLPLPLPLEFSPSQRGCGVSPCVLPYRSYRGYVFRACTINTMFLYVVCAHTTVHRCPNLLKTVRMFIVSYKRCLYVETEWLRI